MDYENRKSLTFIIYLRYFVSEYAIMKTRNAERKDELW